MPDHWVRIVLSADSFGNAYLMIHDADNILEN